jgi:DNA-binding winged helix-turn-helix (wHTH) protein
MKYRFANYEFDEDLRQLRKPDGSSRRLRPQLSKLLTILLSGPGDAHAKQKLIESIWHKHTRATDHDLHNLKRELETALDESGIIKAIPGHGYAITVPVTPAGDLNKGAVAGNGTAGKILPVFPGIGTPAGSLFVHSAADCGKNDYVQYIKRKVKWEARPRQMVLTSEDAPETMVIPFRHALKEGSENQSWWAVVLAVKVNIVTGDWEGTDVTTYNKLVFEARSIPTTFSAKERAMPLLVRLEDNDKDADGGSTRQSTDWHPQEILLPEAFITVELQLEKFNWSAEAWYWNTKAVDRVDIAQIIFGHDSRIPSLEGTIEIRNVRFEI